MRCKGYLSFAGILALCALVPTAAQAELNLWVSYHFQAEENYATGDYQDSEKVLLAALDETTTRHRRAATLDALGQVYVALGQFDKAESYYKEALDLKERALGREHRDVAITLNNLADMYYILEQPERIEELYRRALEVNTRDQYNIEVCRSLNGLALVHNDAGEFVKAEDLLKRAVHKHDHAERRNHPYTATVLVNLGILYTNLGRYDEAEQNFNRASYIHGFSLRPDHPDVAVRLHAMAALYQVTGRGQEAAEYAQEAEEIRAKQAAKGDLY